MQEGPRLGHGAVATVNTKGCGSKQSCLCSLGRRWKWLMCPLAPVWAWGGGARGARVHRLCAGQKDPLALQEWSLTHIVSPSGAASGYIPDSGSGSLASSGWWARVHVVRCFRSRVVAMKLEEDTVSATHGLQSASSHCFVCSGADVSCLEIQYLIDLREKKNQIQFPLFWSVNEKM